MMKSLTLFACIIVSFTGFGQTPAILDKNNVSLIGLDMGNLFQDTATGSAGYEIPKGSGMNAVYTSAFWFGALDAGGQLMTAAQTFGNAGTVDFYAGPYSTNSSYMDSTYMAAYTPAIWSVTSATIDAHSAEFLAQGSVANPHSTILNWPAHGDPLLGVAANLAPFVDLNSDGIYDPYAGDYPEIKGCEGMYIIFNDAAGPSMSSNTPIMGIEVHVLLYQYASTDFLNDVTFIDMNVINRSANTLFSFASASYTDADIGNYQDDYMGSNPQRNLVYGYNGDNMDEDIGGIVGYGANPPALGMMYLNQTMEHSGYYSNGVPAQSDPTNGQEFWNYMHGQWADGQGWVFGGTGYPGSAGATVQPTDHLFYGDPNITSGWEWTEINLDGAGTASQAADRRMFMSSEQGDLAPGAIHNIDLAIVYGRDTSKTNFENIDVMLAVADSVQAFYDTGVDDCNDPFADFDSEEKFVMDFALYPNPSDGSFTVETKNDNDEMTVLIQDAVGRNILMQTSNTSSLDLKINEPSGIYFVTIRSGNHYINKKLIIE